MADNNEITVSYTHLVLQLMHQAQVQVLQSGRSMHITAVGAMFTAELLLSLIHISQILSVYAI